MGTPYLSEIRAFGFGFAPKSWALCQGQLMPINANQALFALLGTTYGGDGRTTFGLPDMRSRLAISPGTDPSGIPYSLGERGGEENHTLQTTEIPAHTHQLMANNSTSGSGSTPSSGTALGVASGPAGQSALQVYGPVPTAASLATQTIANNGGGQSHPNLMPYLAVNYCIALQGIFPSRN